MADLLVRLGVLIGVSAFIWLLVWLGRWFIEKQRKRVLELPATPDTARLAEGVRILAFSTPDCRQCQTLQSPALERLREAYGALVEIIKIDAVQNPEMAQRYRVITVPSTVVLSARGQVQAVNYGFAPMKRLAEQVEAAKSDGLLAFAE